MKKKIFKSSLLIFSIIGFFLFANNITKAAEPLAEIISIIPDTTDTTRVVIKGIVNIEGGTFLYDNYYNPVVLYGLAGDDGKPDVESLKQVPCFRSNPTAGPTFCQFNREDNHSGMFTATITGIVAGGDYVAIPYAIDNRSRIYPIGNSVGKPFSIKGVSTPTATFGSVDVFEKTATIKVSVSNIPMTAIGYLELGIANRKGETAKYTCSAGGPISPKITIPAVSIGTKEISYSFAPPDFPNGLPDGAYCIRPLIDLPAFPKSRIGQGSELDPDTGFWTAPKSIFGIGVSIEPNATADSNANDLGCVNEKDNKSYCLLAPLPGVGDSTGKLDVSTGIGNYFNMIIKLVMGIIGVLAVLMVVVGGIEYMSTVNLGEKEGARARITSAILGLLLALGAYLILKTINPDLVNINIGVPKGVIVEGNPGDDIGESDATIPHTGTATPGVVVPTGTAQELAKQILNSSKITLATESWNGGPSATARQNIIDTINGQGAVTSTRGSKGGTRVPLQTSVLAGAIAVSNVTPIQINAFVNGRHDSSSSRHYVGAAMDIQSAPSEIQRTKTILGACKAAGATEFLGPCNNNVSKKICDATGFPTNSGHQTHIHCGWPR